MSDERIIGSNPHGFKNEKALAYELNERKYKDLNTNLKKFIEYICKQEKIALTMDIMINSEKVKGQVKRDIYIKIDNKEFGVSVKMGSGNSVHQEKVESFISWAKENTDITELEENDLRIMIWADGTTDGSKEINFDENGKVIGRFGAKDFKKLYPGKLERLNNFFDRNRKPIILRALFDGKGQGVATYLYKGTTLNGRWISKEEYIKKFIDVEDKVKRDTPKVGNLTYQAYNSSLQATESGERKRGDIQFKYGSMADDLYTYENIINKVINYGTFEGDKEEFNLSKLMNQNKSHKFWKEVEKKCVIENRENYYVVKVEGQKYSQNAKRKANCKSDNYIIKTLNPLSKDFLLEKEYQITENMLRDVGDYEIIENSGISVKRMDSKNYTITKMTIKTFKSAFEKYIKDIDYIIAGLVFYSSSKQLKMNKTIAEDLDIYPCDFVKYFKTHHSPTGIDFEDAEFMSSVTTISKEIVIKAIEENEELKKALFTGQGWFDSPYYIDFVLTHGELSNDVYMPYYIDNGSGRSKRKYYITLKPL
ncbi:hypothetical protein KQI36_10355 [Clostridium senegalense]|uniref:hypothetical protein n=1 Tax=Clostridium senegalense TaxID=1465809 RepID=UPI001C0FD367|nr:hypothetical protein [Clostridium senegalense]MBU5227040.1 hypothetical protein [Clostridium senegalense]